MKEIRSTKGNGSLGNLTVIGDAQNGDPADTCAALFSFPSYGIIKREELYGSDNMLDIHDKIRQKLATTPTPARCLL